MTLAQYCVRALSYGCLVRDGVCDDPLGRSQIVTMIDNPANGGWVNIVGVQRGDPLEPGYVRYLDQRLKITAEFLSPPDLPPEPGGADD